MENFHYFCPLCAVHYIASMLSRRVLRIKVLHALYEFFQGSNDRIDQAEKAMIRHTEEIYHLYIYQLSALIEIVEVARKIIESGMQKFFPTYEEAHPNMRFVENKVIKLIEQNSVYRRYFDALKINWSEHQELFRKIFQHIRESEDYQRYMNDEKTSFEKDKKFIINIFKDHLADCEELQSLYEEKNIRWVDDYDIVSYLIVKTLNSFTEKTSVHDPLPELFEKIGENDIDEEIEDKTFMLDLFRKTLIRSDEFTQWIAEKAENWEIERIALMDSILLQMALCELTSFPTIPIKVTLNEYIEISKIYSSSKSKVFINGILDKLIIDLKAKNLIRKSGRGLME